MGQALMALPGCLWARPLWASPGPHGPGTMGQALMGFPRHLWARPHEPGPHGPLVHFLCSFGRLDGPNLLMSHPLIYIYICKYHLYMWGGSLVKTANCLEGPKIQSCIGAGPRSERGEPCERSKACLERSDQANDCKVHIAQAKDCT